MGAPAPLNADTHGAAWRLGRISGTSSTPWGRQGDGDPACVYAWAGSGFITLTKSSLRHSGIPCPLRTYRDFLSAVPEEMRRVPVYITERTNCRGWTAHALVQAAYAEIVPGTSKREANVRSCRTDGLSMIVGMKERQASSRFRRRHSPGLPVKGDAEPESCGGPRFSCSYRAETPKARRHAARLPSAMDRRSFPCSADSRPDS